MTSPSSVPRTSFVLLGLAMAFVAAALMHAGGATPPMWKTAAVATVCAVWWATEALPLPATALLPIAVLPLLGVVDYKTASSALGHSTVVLLLSGFVLSRVLERSGAHRRIAVLLVHLVGGSSYRRLVLGFMITTAALSLWISNTAVALMMLPIVEAVYDGDEHAELAAPLLLGVCYAANIGGMGTPIGTPSHPILLAAYEEATGRTIGFLDWMTFGVPLVAILLVVAWLIVTRRLPAGIPVTLESTGSWTRREVAALALFGLTALAWITREDPAGGWVGLLGLVDPDGKALVGDSTVGLFFVVVAFFVPDGPRSRLLEWKMVSEIPWGLLVLIGGGVALARAFSTSGISAAIGDALMELGGWPLLPLVFILCLLVSFMTELMSNTAISTLLMPIIAATAVGMGVAPHLLMLPAVLACSCAFMLPVATGSNAVVFGTGRVRIQRMVRDGFALDIAAVIIITALCTFVLPQISIR